MLRQRIRQAIDHVLHSSPPHDLEKNLTDAMERIVEAAIRATLATQSPQTSAGNSGRD